LKEEQLAFAGATAVIAQTGYYHGGDELYWLEGIRGSWHECCLSLAEESDSDSIGSAGVE
jgi:hypothetical protein